MPHVQEQMRDCIDNCTSCHGICLETVSHCLEQGGRHADSQHITMLLDCAQICQVSADYMLRGSNLHQQTCAVCADVCERCAQDCGQFTEDFMLRCAEECRLCAQSCRDMAKGRTQAAGQR